MAYFLLIFLSYFLLIIGTKEGDAPPQAPALTPIEGIAQVFLCDHPVTGIFVLFGIGITSMELVGYAILGTLFGTLGAAIVGRPRLHDITAGLCGYDGALVGCAC
jgi:urea transporter